MLASLPSKNRDLNALFETSRKEFWKVLLLGFDIR